MVPSGASQHWAAPAATGVSPYGPTSVWAGAHDIPSEVRVASASGASRVTVSVYVLVTAPLSETTKTEMTFAPAVSATSFDLLPEATAWLLTLMTHRGA